MEKKKEAIIAVASVATISALATFLYKKKKSGELQSWLKNFKNRIQKEEVKSIDLNSRNYIPLEPIKQKKKAQ